MLLAPESESAIKFLLIEMLPSHTAASVSAKSEEQFDEWYNINSEIFYTLDF